MAVARLIVVIFAIAFFYARKHPHVEEDEEEAAKRSMDWTKLA